MWLYQPVNALSLCDKSRKSVVPGWISRCLVFDLFPHRFEHAAGGPLQDADDGWLYQPVAKAACGGQPVSVGIGREPSEVLCTEAVSAGHACILFSVFRQQCVL